jgi:carboxypeptidase T
MKALLAILFLVSNHSFAHKHMEDGTQRMLVRFPATDSIKALLHQEEIDVTGIDWKANEVEALVNEEDLQKLIANKAKINFNVPQTMLRGPDPEYLNPEKIEASLKEFASQYPELTQLKSIGLSLQGRNIWAIKISLNPQVRDTKKPVLLFNSMHHAREVMTPEISMDIVDYLLTRYSSDGQVQSWVNENEIWVIPMFNVDGNVRMWERDSMWRKNARDNHGVDLNRNYPTNWNSCNGSSGMRSSQTYRGPNPASEPETQAMMNFVSEIRPVFNISYHSYSELVLYPYGCRPNRTATAAVVESIGREMGRLLNYKPGTPWELLYNADGGDIDWMYEEMQVIPYVLEVNSASQGGFHPDYSKWRDITVEKNRVGWQLLLNRAKGAGVRGQLTSPVKSEVLIYQNSKLIQTYTVNPDGTYHIVLNPGSYELEVRAGSRLIDKRTIAVKENRLDILHDLN